MDYYEGKEICDECGVKVKEYYANDDEVLCKKCKTFRESTAYDQAVDSYQDWKDNNVDFIKENE